LTSLSPKLRTGSYFPEWLLERRKRAESALITVVADCYLAGVSTRRMDKLVKQLGIDSLSKSQVSRMAADLDAIVADFRHRPLGDAGPFTFVAADALTMKVREGGRVINAVVLLATGVNADGHREVLGMRVATSETGSLAAWAGSAWSPPTPTRGSSRPSRRTYPAPAGRDAAPITQPTSCR
jgi:putative transposase